MPTVDRQWTPDCEESDEGDPEMGATALEEEEESATFSLGWTMTRMTRSGTGLAEARG